MATLTLLVAFDKAHPDFDEYFALIDINDEFRKFLVTSKLEKVSGWASRILEASFESQPGSTVRLIHWDDLAAFDEEVYDSLANDTHSPWVLANGDGVRSLSHDLASRKPTYLYVNVVPNGVYWDLGGLTHTAIVPYAILEMNSGNG